RSSTRSFASRARSAFGPWPRGSSTGTRRGSSVHWSAASGRASTSRDRWTRPASTRTSAPSRCRSRRFSVARRSDAPRTRRPIADGLIGDDVFCGDRLKSAPVSVDFRLERRRYAPRVSREAGRPTIGMLTGSLVDLFEDQWLGAVDAAREQQVDLVCFVGRELEDPRGFGAQANAIYDLVDPQRLDGLIVWTTTLGLFVGPERLDEFCRRFEPLPIISVEQVLAGSPSLLMDNRHGMFDAISHLIETHDLRRIGFVRGPDQHAGAQERYQGYLDALTAHELPHDPALVSPPAPFWNPAAAIEMVEKLLAEG